MSSLNDKKGKSDGIISELYKLIYDEEGGVQIPDICRTPFRKFGVLKKEIVKNVFNFAYEMTFLGKGKHRCYRSGGSEKRKNGQIFKDVFQGKLAEFALYEIINEQIPYEKPDVTPDDEGIWDNTDAIIKGYNLNIKSAKYFSNLLLLEMKDWNDKGQYIPNIDRINKCSNYDYHVFIRIHPSCEDILKKHRVLYNVEISEDIVTKLKHDIIENTIWEYDIPRWCDKHILIQAIKERNILEKNKNIISRDQTKKTLVDADNYYIATSNLQNVDELINILTDLPNKM